MRKREKEALERKQYKAKLAYNNNFNKEAYKQIAVRFSYEKEADILEFLANFDSPKEAIANALRAEMKRMNRRKKKAKDA